MRWFSNLGFDSKLISEHFLPVIYNNYLIFISNVQVSQNNDLQTYYFPDIGHANIQTKLAIHIYIYIYIYIYILAIGDLPE